MHSHGAVPSLVGFLFRVQENVTEKQTGPEGIKTRYKLQYYIQLISVMPLSSVGFQCLNVNV